MKNKYQEALDTLEYDLDVCSPKDDVTIEHQNELIRILQELVDKETPMKATKDKEPDCFGCIWFRCPKCTDCVLKFNKYCVTCGQKLDWSDE